MLYQLNNNSICLVYILECLNKQADGHNFFILAAVAKFVLPSFSANDYDGVREHKMSEWSFTQAKLLVVFVSLEFA